jgi:hypothetical protein
MMQTSYERGSQMVATGDVPVAEHTPLETAVNLARAHADDTARLAHCFDALVCRLNGTNLEEVKATMHPLPTGLMTQLDVYQKDMGRALDDLNGAYDRLLRML